AARLYNGVQAPLAVEGRAPETWDTLGLTLMDADGFVLAGPVLVEPGPAHLDRLLPAVHGLRRTGYLQLMDGHVPIGPALVLQPMLSRLVPISAESINPDGIRYTRIVGWHDELHPPPPEEAPGGEPGTIPAGEPASDEPETSAGLPADDERLYTGFRAYPERDVVLHTSHGSMRIALRPDQAPNTAWNFRHLASGGFYDGIVFHRVVPLTRDGEPFVIQAGDPTGTGDGGPGYWLPVEPSGLAHDFGVISMARDVAPDSAGSQFFIGLSRAGTARLDGHYCAFGQVVEGADTIRAIADVEIDLQAGGVAIGRPVSPPVIERAEVVDAPPRLPGRGRPDEPVSIRPRPDAAPDELRPAGRLPR
ncbi:MAG: peptidylprolyl isomerase, partial [Planctomycetota bacterium]